MWKWMWIDVNVNEPVRYVDIEKDNARTDYTTISGWANTHESRYESSCHAKHIKIWHSVFFGVDFAPQGCSLCVQCSSWSKIWFNSSVFWNMACAFGAMNSMNHSSLFWNQPVLLVACCDRTFLLCAFFPVRCDSWNIHELKRRFCWQIWKMCMKQPAMHNVVTECWHEIA